ncbi:MAG: hypothetical protein WAT81_01645 [Candidatus Moraniibacteriota bacterium]
MRVVLASLALAFLAGCSSLPRESGFDVRTVKAEGRQEPWQNRAINREAFSPEGVAAVYVKLPQPLPKQWKEEFVDLARTYEVKAGPRKAQKPLERVVFRAIALYGPGETGTYDAVLDRKAQGFTVFVPLVDAERIRGKSLFILSSDGKWGMTVLGTLVEFEKGFAPDRLPPGFLTTHPSTVTQVIRLNPIENEHARLALDGVATAFPVRFSLRDKAGAYVGTPDIVTVLAEFTSVEDIGDRLISCTSLKLGPGSFSALPIVAAFYGIQAGVALAKEDCKK